MRREGRTISSLVLRYPSCIGNGPALTPRMLPNNQYPIPQREPLIRIIRDRRIHRSMADRNASRCRNYPSNV